MKGSFTLTKLLCGRDRDRHDSPGGQIIRQRKGHRSLTINGHAGIIVREGLKITTGAGIGRRCTQATAIAPAFFKAISGKGSENNAAQVTAKAGWYGALGKDRLKGIRWTVAIELQNRIINDHQRYLTGDGLILTVPQTDRQGLGCAGGKTRFTGRNRYGEALLAGVNEQIN